jgi:hypothetical protein
MMFARMDDIQERAGKSVKTAKNALCNEEEWNDNRKP